MTSSKGDQYDFHTDISNVAAVHGTAAARDSVADAPLKPLVETGANELGGATANVLTVEVIKERLRASRSEFGWIDQPESGAMFRRWVAAAHSPEKFEKAVRAVEADFSIERSPRAIDRELRDGGARRDSMLRAAQAARRRGGVAL